MRSETVYCRKSYVLARCYLNKLKILADYTVVIYQKIIIEYLVVWRFIRGVRRKRKNEQKCKINFMEGLLSSTKFL